jgi:hypothetical protein
LDVVWVIISTCASHAFWLLVVGHHIRVIGERVMTDCADAFLFDDLAVQELSHLSARSQFPISARMMGIVDAPNAKLAWTRLSHLLSAATEERFMNRA